MAKKFVAAVHKKDGIMVPQGFKKRLPWGTGAFSASVTTRNLTGESNVQFSFQMQESDLFYFTQGAGEPYFLSQAAF